MLANVWLSDAQVTTILHKESFKKGKFATSSRPNKPDDWEKPFFDSAVRTVFPSDLARFPEKNRDKLIHLTGIIDSVYADTLVYGNFKKTVGNYPCITALQIKVIDYEWYSEKIISYEVKRDKMRCRTRQERHSSIHKPSCFLRVAGKGQKNIASALLWRMVKK